MFVSVIIPVYNGGAAFARCLDALSTSQYAPWECIVVDDGSEDNSAEIARQHHFSLLHTPMPQSGPALARNIGAAVAQGDILFFLDADVLIKHDTIGRIADLFVTYPDMDACFGSYDDTPTAPNFLSQYRNLQHHYVHQMSNPQATTFWAGCGAIRRPLFLEMGGFDTVQFSRPSIEDIELGYRLHRAGHAIRLEKTIQVTHTKRWTAATMLRTDIRDRAWPWTRLIVQSGDLPGDLNLQRSQRISALAVLAGIAALLLTPLLPPAIFALFMAIVVLILLNRRFYRYLWRKRGLSFALAAMPWHWLYFFYSTVCFALGSVWFRARVN